MPELPEVETVRDGLARWVLGRTVTDVTITHPRAVRRHLPGAQDLRARLIGHRFVAACRRGKYLWLPIDGEDTALVAHLGMSGQLLVTTAGAPDGPHLHVRMRFAAAPDAPGEVLELRFADQRTFGGLQLDRLVATGDGDLVPSVVAHIGRDPFDAHYDLEAVISRARRRNSEIKRVLLDQSLVSGIGNIYADEALWRARLNARREASRLRASQLRELFGHVRAVMAEALRQGGTSFDAMYVNVNGSSGYFERSLNVYGREGEPCARCGTAIRRVAFMNRSSFFCPHCQPVPRPRRSLPAARTGGI